VSLIAITGVTGFVGSAVLDEALRQGHTVRALTRREQAPREGVEWLRGDLGDAAALAALAQGADAVIHVAGLTNTPDPAQFEVANVTGTANVIAAMKQAGARRLVFVSSLSAGCPRSRPMAHPRPRPRRWLRPRSLDWTTVRPPGVYGPRDVDYLEMFRTPNWALSPCHRVGRARSSIRMIWPACW
jgi:nucleoside-diphosphate-sugar epimerase